MNSRKFRPAQRKTQRRWRVPPALMHGDEVFEGLSVLDEVPGELGLVLWQSLRDAMLWGRAAPNERDALFTPGAEAKRMAEIVAVPVPDAVEAPLAALARVVGGADGMREENVALACRQVAQWADGRGWLACSLAFTQAAAVVTPGDAATAFAVGRLARRRAENARAESWFRRAIALARQMGDWGTYAQSFIGLGTLYAQKGNFPSSRRFFERSLRAAERNSLHAVRALALHELFSIEAEMGRPEEAMEYARASLEAFGPEHPGLPRLAHDVAYYWMEQGQFGPAFTVFRRLDMQRESAETQLMWKSDLARAAAGIGDVETFRRAWDEAQEFFDSAGAEEAWARSYLEFARGALMLNAWEVAERSARRGLEIATRRGESKVRFVAESLLDSAEHHRMLVENRATITDEGARTAEVLAEQFVTSLEPAGAA